MPLRLPLRNLAVLTAVLALSATAAHAHFKLLEPSDWLVTNDLGDPQKVGPCGGPGTSSGAVTQVVVGQRLKFRWRETIGHPGHYRIALAQNRAQFVDPVLPNGCRTATIQNPPVAPVIADGLFPHAMGMTGQEFEHEITVPDAPCEKCTFQIIEFMSSTAAASTGCFYYHCADVQIVRAGVDGGGPPDAGQPDASVDAGDPGPGADGGGSVDAGGTGGSLDGGVVEGGGGHGGHGEEEAEGDAGHSESGHTHEGTIDERSQGGCLSVARGGGSFSFLAMAMALLFGARALRRRR